MAESWQVVSQRQSSVLVGGTFEDAMIVTFKTASGTTGSVTVPLSQYTADNVAQLIDQRVEAIDAVHAIKPSQGSTSSPGGAS